MTVHIVGWKGRTLTVNGRYSSARPTRDSMTKPESQYFEIRSVADGERDVTQEFDLREMTDLERAVVENFYVGSEE